MSDENEFGRLLESLQVRRGWTQEDAVAHIIKDEATLQTISLRTYSDWITGKRLPSQKQLKLVATGFKLSQADEDALYLAAAQTAPKIHNLPFPRNPLFTGREKQLERLGQLLKENYSVALSGLAGIGKTQLALEYAHRSYIEKVYRAVFWVNAADEESLKIGYRTLAAKLDLPERDEHALHKIIRAVKDWLERHTNWLLIMDNADNLQLARSFFPEVSEDNNGHILLTTRSQMVDNIARKIDIDKMKPAEGLLFLLLRSLPDAREDKAKLDTVAADTRHAASQIVELLDGHPLALDQAGAYIEDGGSFTDYIDRYHEKRLELLSERGSMDEENEGKYSEYPDSVLVTFELCFEKVHKRNPLATDILRFCAFLQPDAIPEELFQLDESFKLDKRALRKGITALLRYSLIARNAQEKTLSMHRLVQDVLLDTISPDLQDQWAERAVQALHAMYPPIVEITDSSMSLVCEVLNYFEQGKDGQPEPFINRVVSDLREGIVAENSDTAKSISVLALLYQGQGEYWQAEHLYRRALTIFKKHLGAEHPDVALPLYGLAILMQDRGRHKQAEALYMRALSIQEQLLGTTHPHVQARKRAYADFLYSIGRDAEAAALEANDEPPV